MDNQEIKFMDLLLEFLEQEDKANNFLTYEAQKQIKHSTNKKSIYDKLLLFLEDKGYTQKVLGEDLEQARAFFKKRVR